MPNNGVMSPGHAVKVRPERGLWRLLGPAFVASIAYVDPGNVAANLTAGAAHGYLLVWVLVASNATAVLVQYLSAKLGLVTGMSLPELLGARMGRWGRRSFWVQAEVVAAATDVAEVVGGAIALSLLFNLPLVWGGLITGTVSMALLAIQTRRGQQPFEFVIMGMLVVIAFGFLAGLFVSPVDWLGAAGGLVPRFDGAGTVVLAASMLGATVMPHAIYLHSALARDRHVPCFGPEDQRPDGCQGAASLANSSSEAATQHLSRLPRLLIATKLDVFWSLIIAGSVNIAMLLLAAASLRGVGGTDTISGAHRAIVDSLGPAIGVIFAIGLLASGLASTSIGAYAGAVVMGGLLKKRIPLVVRRLLTLIPALIVLGIGADPTYALVLSQVVLSLGIPFALIPLVRFTNSRKIMGDHASKATVRAIAWVVVALIVALNLALLAITFLGT